MNQQKIRDIVHQVYEDLKKDTCTEFPVETFDNAPGGDWFPPDDREHFTLEEVVVIAGKLKSAGFRHILLLATAVTGTKVQTVSIRFGRTKKSVQRSV